MIRDNILVVGDSITEGYNDSWDQTNIMTVSTRGLAGKLAGGCWVNDMTNPIPMAHNWGQSGSMLSAYLNRTKGLIEADPTMYTSCLYSVWSPNKPSTEVAEYANEATTLSANRQLVLDFNDYLLSKSIIPIPTFIYASPAYIGSPQGVRLANEMNWMRTHFSVDGTVSGSYMAFCGGISYADGGLANSAYYPSEYRGYPIGDATHPNIAGYNIYYAYILANYSTLRANSILANGFIENP